LHLRTKLILGTCQLQPALCKVGFQVVKAGAASPRPFLELIELGLVAGEGAGLFSKPLIRQKLVLSHHGSNFGSNLRRSLLPSSAGLCLGSGQLGFCTGFGLSSLLLGSRASLSLSTGLSSQPLLFARNGRKLTLPRRGALGFDTGLLNSPPLGFGFSTLPCLGGHIEIPGLT